jgi:hypothetical protein
MKRSPWITALPIVLSMAIAQPLLVSEKAGYPSLPLE